MVAIAIHDGIYLVDFCVQHIDLSDKQKGEDGIADWVIEKMKDYEQKNAAKFVGAGVPYDLLKKCPKLCSRLWLELDVVPISIAPELEGLRMESKETTFWDSKCVDEQADSMARKCIMNFGPSLAPLLQVGFRGLAEVDAGFQARLLIADDYEKSCSATTWNATMKYIMALKQNKTKIAFFSSTPQGGGVALMRHALVRFAKVMGVDLAW
jgi:alpha,alpha-trehalose phosphorylase (configuration-retaining)